MKIYKRIMKAFGGAGLYVDKTMLNHLGAMIGDEVIIELKDDCLIIKKSGMDLSKIQGIIDAKSKERN
jgi:antitoxin component of MazEF toxin-antitoxin module